MISKSKASIPNEQLLAKVLKSNPNSFENLVELNPKLLINQDPNAKLSNPNQ